MTKWEFIQHEMIVLSIQGAFPRAGVYSSAIPDGKTRTALRRRLASLPRDLRGQYSRPVSGQQHQANIKKIADDLTLEFRGKGVLHADRFRIGIAQKALNL
jgi:hypothetical protein